MTDKMSRPKFRPTVYDLEKENHFVTKISTNTTEEYPNVVFLRAKIRITPLSESNSLAIFNRSRMNTSHELNLKFEL